jgi:hypothetical protein
MAVRIAEQIRGKISQTDPPPPHGGNKVSADRSEILIVKTDVTFKYNLSYTY